jgi:hypothetical protein
MQKWQAGDTVQYGRRVEGGITYNGGVILPFGGGNTLWVLSDLDSEIHEFRRLKNGEYILATEQRDDPKQRLWMRKMEWFVDPATLSNPWPLAKFAKNPSDPWVLRKWFEMNS